MKATAPNETDELIGELKDGCRTVIELPHGGFLFLEHDVPFLLIYRKRENDNATLRLARTGASYLIIGEDNFEYFTEFVNQLTEKMSARFGSFILMEIYSGAEGSTEFVIRGPSHKLPVSLDVLRKQLEQVESRIGITGFVFEGGQHNSKISEKNHEGIIWFALQNACELSLDSLKKYPEAAKMLEEKRKDRKTFEIKYRQGLNDGDNFKMEPSYSNFQKIKKGELLAKQNGKEVQSEWNAYIFMPLYQSQGNDGFFVVEEVC